MTFDELKDRMAQRLHALGIRIKSIEEDEYCLIPMGGVLPTFPQRTLGIGGTAGMVHPSTGCVGFRICAWTYSMESAPPDVPSHVWPTRVRAGGYCSWAGSWYQKR